MNGPGKELVCNKAVFFDRDGVVNELVLNKEEGQIGSPLSASAVRIFDITPKVIKEVQQMGFKAIIISNQPGVAKKQFSYSEFLKINTRIRKTLKKYGCQLDGEYYCLHHPSALIAKYRMDCDCRKPKPGLIIRAASDNNISFHDSFFVGDGLVDIRAGKAAGCKTILISHMTNLLNQMMKKDSAFPDYLVDSLKEVPSVVCGASKRKVR